MSYFLNNIDAMEAYVPGEQPKDGMKVIKLNTNENPYPPSPAVADALHDFDTADLRAYPNPMAERFRQVVAKALNVPADWIIPGDGSDDLIAMISRACLSGEKSVVYPVPTFTFYETQGMVQNAKIVEVPLNDDFSLPTDELIKAAGDVTFIANPNSPTGVAADNAELRRLAEGLSGILVIDEAYADFADSNALELVKEYENIIILRTLSKSYAMAGIRLGFGITQPAIMDGLLKTKAIYNVGEIPAALGAAAVDDQDYMKASAEKIKASRKKLTSQLEAIGFQVLPSQTNFILASVPDGTDAGDVFNALKARGIFVRYYNQPRLADKLRITIGTPEENAALVAALKDF